MNNYPYPTNEYVIVTSDYFNALYHNMRLIREGSPERLSVYSLEDDYPNAAVLRLSETGYDNSVAGGGYPSDLLTLPFAEITRYA